MALAASGLPPYLMLYEGQDGSVGLASAAAEDDGAPGPLRKVTTPLLVAVTVGGVDGATAVLLEDGLAIYYSAQPGAAQILGVETTLAGLRAFVMDGTPVT